MFQSTDLSVDFGDGNWRQAEAWNFFCRGGCGAHAKKWPNLIAPDTAADPFVPPTFYVWALTVKTGTANGMRSVASNRFKPVYLFPFVQKADDRTDICGAQEVRADDEPEWIRIFEEAQSVAARDLKAKTLREKRIAWNEKLRKMKQRPVGEARVKIYKRKASRACACDWGKTGVSHFLRF